MEDNIFLQHKRGDITIAFLCSFPVKFRGMEVLEACPIAYTAMLKTSVVPGKIEAKGQWLVESPIFQLATDAGGLIESLLKQEWIEYIIVDKYLHRAIRNVRDSSPYLKEAFKKIHTPDHLLKDTVEPGFKTVYDFKFYS